MGELGVRVGVIAVESGRDQGTTFTVRLPRGGGPSRPRSARKRPPGASALSRRK